MFTRSPFHPRQSTRARSLILWALCAVLLILALAAFKAGTPRSHASSKRQPLSFEDRVAAQRAIAAVYHAQRLWPADNPQPKPALDEVLPAAALRAQVAEYLRQANALAQLRQRPLTAEELQAEVERMARQTRQPAVLEALWAALGRDPFVIAECLARPLLAERLLRMRIADCGVRIGECESLDSSSPQSAIHNPQFEEWWSGVREAMGVEVAAPEFAYRLPEIAAVAAPCGSDGWTATNTTGAPTGRRFHTVVWTGSEMIIWGGFGISDPNSGGRYNPATDAWTATSTTGAPSGRNSHTAVWTGSEMIIWSGSDSSGRTSTGGRYNPVTNAWTATSTTNAPSGRIAHTAVWTGNQMIVWGGNGDPFGSLNTGGRYNPATDAWTATGTVNHPGGRDGHTAVWTGSEMIVWGGYATNDPASNLNSGGRYNPATDVWASTSLTVSPSARGRHTAVWTGTEMIIWGGQSFPDLVSTGGRYNPTMDSWATTNTTSAPSSRFSHTAVWTGGEMIIWGGAGSGFLNVGGRYSPAIDAWAATGTTGAPSGRYLHTAIWAGSEMIIWGGFVSSDPGPNTGGRYSLNLLTVSPTTQSFTATGGTGSVAVTAQGGCTWTATSNAGFITITAGSSGAGNGTVSFSVAPNTSQNARTGTLSVGGQGFTVTQSGENPVPALAGLSPNSANAGAAAFTLTVNGTGFVNGATVRWNGNTRTTTVVGATQLTAQIPASDLLTLGPAAVTVFNPAPGGGASTAQSFNVTATVSSISAASFSGAELAADSIVAAFGSELATQTLAAPVTPLPTTLAGTTVRVRDSAGVERPAPLFFVAAGQVNYLLPAGTAAGAATVTITSGSGKLSLGAVRIAAVAPGLFAANANGQGVPAAVALRVKGDGAQSFEPVAQFDAAAGRFIPAPIDLGAATEQVILLLFGTGMRGRSALAAVTCTMGGGGVPVSFAGAQGDLVGLDQINVGPLPRGLAGRGEVDLVLLVDGKAANTVRVNIR